MTVPSLGCDESLFFVVFTSALGTDGDSLLFYRKDEQTNKGEGTSGNNDNDKEDGEIPLGG
jgi:hypothetical protein